MIALPGHLERQPAIDAEISVLGSGQRTRSDGSGNFLLEGLTESTGELLFRYDINRDGQWDRQRLLSIATLKAGPGRQVAVGDVLLVENARLHGKVLLEGAAAPAHAGTLAFVPEGPFTALSSDDGSFVFDALPDGELRLAFFRTGYLPDGFTELTLSGGQDLSLRDITLKPIPPGPVQPALLTGRVVLIPAGMVTQTLARLSEPGGMSVSAPVANDGTFQFMRLPGVYTLTLDTPGYLGARLPNLLLSPGETALGDVVLLQGVSGTGGGAGAGGGGVSGTGGGSGAGGGGASGTGSGGGSLGADSPVAVLAGATAVRLNDPAARIDGTRSYDPLDAGPLIFHWLEETDAGVTLSSNHSLLSGTPTFKAPAAPTTLRFALIVTSQGGRTSAPAHTQIEVVAPPIPVVMPPMLTMRPGTMAVFSAASSTDPASAPLTFRWFVLSGGITVSGTIGPTTNVTAPLGQGAAQLRLVVSNPGVSADPVDIPILIDAIGTTAAMVSVTPPQVVGFSDVVAVAAMASSTIPGEGFAYTWTRTQGPAVPLSGTNSQTLGFNAPPTSASFRFHVSVVGDAGSVGSAIAQVEVDDDVPPVLVASDPIDAAGSAGGWYSLTASFDEPLEPTTVSSANLHVRDGTLDLPVDVHYESAGNTVRVTPRRPLTPGQVYTFVIGALADTSARHNVFPGRSIAFNARSPRFTGWKRSASYSVKQGPGVVATSSQVWTLGVSVLGSPVWQMQRPNFLDGGVLDSQYFSANGGVSDAHRGQVANDVASWFFNGSTQGTYWYLASASWVIGSSGGPKATCSDGDRLAGLSENYGPHWGFIPAGGPLTETFYEDSRPLSYAGDSNDPGYACAVNGAHGLITVPLQTTRLLRVMATTGGAWQVLSTGLTGGVKFARAAYIGPSPLVCYAQATGVMSCSLWTGTAFVTGADLGPGTAGPLDLMSRNAGTAWLSYIAGNQVRLKSVWGQADAGSLDVTDWSGPMGTPSWNGDPSCTADTPELALAADALYLVWEESCAAGSFQLMLQKVD